MANESDRRALRQEQDQQACAGAADEGRQTQIETARGSADEREGGRDQAEAHELAGGRERLDIGFRVNRRAQLATLRHQEHEICDEYGDARRRSERREPLRKRRHRSVKHDEIGRVGDRQDEARGVGDEGANEQIGQGFDIGGPCRGIDGRRQDDSGRVVRQEDRDDRSHAVHERKQPSRGSARRLHGMCGSPVEQAFLPCKLGEQHHADEEEIDVRSLEDGCERALRRQKLRADERCGAGEREDIFGQAPRAQKHASGRKDRDGDRCERLERHRAGQFCNSGWRFR